MTDRILLAHGGGLHRLELPVCDLLDFEPLNLASE
jgi:hypothetical protein